MDDTNTAQDVELAELIEPVFWQFDQFALPDRKPRSGPPAAARYLRRSIGETDDFESTSVQNELTAGYIDEIGAVCRVPDHVFIDRKRSGITIQDREGLIRLLKEIVRGNIDLVVCSRKCRLTRKPRDAAWLEEFFDRHGTEFHVVGEGRVQGLEMGLGAFEAQESRKGFLVRSQEGTVEAARLGRFIGLRENYGYDRTEDLSGWTINAFEAGIIRRCAHTLDGETNPNKLARTLNSEGLPSPRGKLWRPKIFFNIDYGLLTRTILKGLYTFQHGNELVEIERPELQILEVDLFDRLQKKYVDGRRSTENHKSCGKYVVPMVRCSCGAPVFMGRNARGSSIYCSTAAVGGDCRPPWNLSTAETTRSILLILRDEILDPLRRTEWDGLLRRDWEMRMAAADPRRAEIKAELEEIDREVDNEPQQLLDDLAAGIVAVRNRLEMLQIDLAEELDALDEPKPMPLLDAEEISGLRDACIQMITRLPETHFRDVDEAVLGRLREILQAVVLTTDSDTQRYEVRLLLGLPGSVGSRVLPDASSPRWIVRSFPRPVKGALRFPDTVLLHHRRAEKGEFALSDHDWELVRHLFAASFRNGFDPRLVAEAALFTKLTAVPFPMLPERYFGLAEEARRRMPREWPKMFDILRSRGSDRVRTLLQNFVPNSANHVYAHPAP